MIDRTYKRAVGRIRRLDGRAAQAGEAGFVDPGDADMVQPAQIPGRSAWPHFFLFAASTWASI
jgi:hypothetical protein